MNYQCPKCARALSILGGIVLVGENSERRTLFAFDPEPGKYELHVSDGLEVIPGTVWEFSCPLCGENITTSFNRKLARLEVIGDDGSLKRVVFSKVADDQATFVLGGDDIEHHGRDSLEYIKKDD